MPSPNSSLATLRPDLGGSLEEFNLLADRQGFIGTRVLPVFDTVKKNGNFGRISVEELLQHPETLRAPGGGYNRRKWKFEPDSYSTQEHGLEEAVDDSEAEMYRDYFDAEVVSAERALDGVLRAQELRAAQLLFNPANFTPMNVETPWTSGGTPIDDVEAARLATWEQSGLWPDALIITKHVFLRLRRNEQVLDQIKSDGAGESVKASNVNVSMLSQVFDLEVIVAGGTGNAANPGQDAEFEPLWSDEYAMVAKVCRNPRDIREPGLGRTMHYSADGSQIGGTVEMYRDETVRGDVVRVRHDVQEKLLHSVAAKLLGNIKA